MFSHIFFFIALAFIITHELDAIKHHEWRILPITSQLSDKLGYTVFTLMHIPLFAVCFFYLYNGSSLNQKLITGLNIFFIVHIFLHLLALRHPKNEFSSFRSWFIIVGAGISAFLDLLL